MSSRFPSISQDSLRRSAGPAVYARGAAYQADGRVDLLSVDQHRVLARVRGSEPYRVELREQAGRAAGTCNCRAFEDAGFCKHLVAVALAQAEASQAEGQTDRLSPVRDYLLAEGAERLADRLLRLAEQDLTLLDAIEREIADAQEDDATLIARWRTAIDHATDTDGGIDYYGAGDYAEEVAQVFGGLERLAQSGRPAVALILVEHLIDRLEEAHEEADDSNGEISDVTHRAVAFHLELCGQTAVDPLALASRLFEWEMSDAWDEFTDAAATYEAPLGDVGLAEFRQLTNQAWAARGREPDHRLKAILDGFAKRDGDIEARIALHRQDLTSLHAYQELAGICAEAGRLAEALGWVDEALWRFEDQPSDWFESYAAHLFAGAGRQADAERILWRAFERAPTLHLYRDLKALSTDASVIDRALPVLRAAVLNPPKSRRYFGGTAAILFDVQVEEGLVSEAWETSQAHDVGETRRRALADSSASSHAALAAAAYEGLIEQRIGASNYDEAIKLIRRCGEIRSDAAAQAAYIADLHIRHKAKRSFIPRLRALG